MELKLEQQFKKGALEMVLLSLIARQRSYGYELISRLQREGGGLFQETKEGTLYPILYRLEAAGLIRCRTEGLQQEKLRCCRAFQSDLNLWENRMTFTDK